MLVKIKTLTGMIYSLEVESNCSVEHLKDELHLQVPSIPRKGQKLIFSGQIIEGEISLESVGLKDGDFVVILICRQPKPTQINETSPTANDIVNATEKLKEQNKLQEANQTKEDKVVEKSVVQLCSSQSGIVSESTSHSTPVANSSNTTTSSTLSSSSSSSLSLSPTTPTIPADNNVRTETRQPPVDPTALRQLQDMGFAENRASKALLLHRMDTQIAMEWLLVHNDDADIDEPLTQAQLRDIAQTSLNRSTDNDGVQQLRDMGFSEEAVRSALRVSHNNQEAALAWLLGEHRDNGENGENDEGSSDEEDYEALGEELGIDSELIMTILNQPSVQDALKVPGVVAALEHVIEDPSQAERYMNDATIGPILLQLRTLIEQQQKDSNDEDEEDDTSNNI